MLRYDCIVDQSVRPELRLDILTREFEIILRTVSLFKNPVKGSEKAGNI